jgi:protein TonB
MAILGVWTRPLTDLGQTGHIINLDVVEVAGDTASLPLPPETPDTPETVSDSPAGEPGISPARPDITGTRLPTALPVNAADNPASPMLTPPATVAAAGPAPHRPDPEHHLRDTLLELVANNLRYPAIARRRGWQGIVVLQLRIESGGKISRLIVNASSGYPVLDRAAIECLRLASIPQAERWLNGKAVEILVPVEYRLLDS